MRTIKFRGKRVDNGEWVYGHYFLNNLTDENSGLPPENGWFFLQSDEELHLIRDEHGGVCSVDPETVGQFVGLHDKDGAEVYEGDILDHSYHRNNPGISEVVFRHGAFEAMQNDFGWEGENLISIQLSKKIGNIHDNPEL